MDSECITEPITQLDLIAASSLLMPLFTDSLRTAALVASTGGVGSTALVLIWLLWYCGGFGWDKRLVFNFHPLLMATAWLVLTTQAVLAYRVLPLSHHSAKLYHAALHTATLVLVGIALTAVFYFHEINHYPHLSALLPADLSTHLARCQLASSLIHSLKAHATTQTTAYVVGLISFLYPGLSSSLRRFILPYHSYIGLLLAVLPTITICLGLLEKVTFMQIAASKSQTDEIAHGRWLANSAGLLALACMAAVVYVLVSGGRAVRNGDDDGDREVQEAEKEEEEEGEDEVSVGHGEQVEGERSVFSVPVPYPSETSNLLPSADDGKQVDESLHRGEDAAPPASFATYVDEMLDKHFTRRASRGDNMPSMAVRVDEYGTTAQYRRESGRHSGRSTSAAAPATAPRKNSDTAPERVELSSRRRVEPEQMSPTSPESMWPKYKGVGTGGVILQSP